MPRGQLKYSPPPGQLHCPTCNLDKPYDEISSANYILSKGHKSGECKLCRRKRKPTYEVKRAQELRQRYKLTVEQYAEMFAAQSGVCAICKRPPQKNCLHVDHDRGCCPGPRSCGECIRGLLCPSCNSNIEWWITYGSAIESYAGGLRERVREDSLPVP